MHLFKSTIIRVLPRGLASTLRSLPANARRYLVVAALQNSGYGIIGTTFALFVKDRGFSEAVVGDVEAALALAGAAACLLLPPLVSSFGYRWLIVTAGVALGLARFGQAFAGSAVVLIALGLLFGLGDGAMQVMSSAFLSENAGRARRTGLFTADFVVRTSAMVTGALIGGVLPALLAPSIGEVEAVRWAIVVAALLMGASAIVAMKIEEGRRPRTGSIAAAWLGSFRGFSSWGRVGRLLVPEVLISLGAGLIIPFVALFLRHQVGATVTHIGVIQAVSAIAMAVAALATPRIAKRIGLAGTIVLTEVLSLPFLLLIPLSTSLPVTAVLFWVRGMLMNMSWPIYNQLSMEGVPTADKPLVAGWVRFGWSVAWLTGSAIGGRLMESSYTAGYYYAAALYGLGALATLLLLRRITVEEHPQSA